MIEVGLVWCGCVRSNAEIVGRQDRVAKLRQGGKERVLHCTKASRGW